MVFQRAISRNLHDHPRFLFQPNLFPGRRYFLTKNCIHQADPELNYGSLLCLGYTISRCKGLICFVDQEYFERLWCMYIPAPGRAKKIVSNCENQTIAKTFLTFSEVR